MELRRQSTNCAGTQVPRVIIVFALSTPTPKHKLVFHLKSVSFGAKKKKKRENENDPKKAACCHCYYLVITYYFYDHRWLSSSFGFLSGEQVKLMKKNVSPTFCPSRPNPTSALVTPTRCGLCPFRSALLVLLWPLFRLYGFWGFCFIALGKCHKDNNGPRRQQAAGGQAGVENLNKMWQMVFYLINWLNRLSCNGIAHEPSKTKRPPAIFHALCLFFSLPLSLLQSDLTFMAVIE